ncbi:hypothetical protein H2198_004878 [Neophaeococcomyces mojaviensis]|uniref:Uncharacterized protein n=1 Tax=Neophaeococcomyces mojaviensis TaxID=3383035 RepID=A0ACC3A786_9EURO|nr:hypothetical protein H2198_004878 [Knufia sp. JES_112]
MYPRRIVRHSSTDTPAPSLLAKIKGDLKTAMKAKDAPRLNVLRAMITEYNNASKTSTPIKTDLQMLALLKKKKVASEAAAAEAKAASRSDLAEKQIQEIKVIDEYAGEVKLMSEDELQSIVSVVVDNLKAAASGAELKAGQVLKEAFQPGGMLDGKPVDKSQVAKLVNNMLGVK